MLARWPGTRTNPGFPKEILPFLSEAMQKHRRRLVKMLLTEALHRLFTGPTTYFCLTPEVIARLTSVLEPKQTFQMKRKSPEETVLPLPRPSGLLPQ